MVEINLIPDIKAELIKSQRILASVITAAVFIGGGAVALVVLLAMYTYGFQTLSDLSLNKTIDSESAKLSKVEGLAKTLTIQHQLHVLPQMHSEKHIDSRVITLLSDLGQSIPEQNAVSVNTFTLDTDTNTITIEAQAASGYPALEVYKKTLEGTIFDYTLSGDKTAKSIPMVSGISDSDRSYGEDASGARVLRFTLSFTYPDEFLSPSSKDIKISTPTRKNVTDSYLSLPKNLFSDRVQNLEGGQ